MTTKLCYKNPGILYKGTRVRTCKVRPISLSSTGEKKTLIFYTAPLPPPAKVTGMDESASQTPPSHPTSFFSSATNSQPLSPCLQFSNFMCPPFLSFIHPASVSAFSFRFSPSFTLTSITWGLYFSKKDGRGGSRSVSPPQKSHRESNADLNSQFASYTFSHSCLRRTSKELWERQRSGCLVNIREHLEILEHQLSLLKVCQSMCRDWKSAREEAWWDFSAAVSHTFHTFWAGLVWHSSDSETRGQEGKTRTICL